MSDHLLEQTVESILANLAQLLLAVEYAQPLGPWVFVSREMFNRILEDLKVCVSTIRHDKGR
ncbi:MAG TPA: hypothetical protein VLQ80_25860 [Candidatus Saccharimonadia bacterium]|nr:hypothetical protein [Candidatus Saccharimonadia bacterium]